MKRTFMIGVAAGALLAGVNLAAAQGYGQQQMPGASGGANIEQKGGAEMKGGKARAQGQTEMKGGAEVKGGKNKASAQGELKGGAETKGGKARAQAQGSGEMKAQETQKPGEKMKGEKGKNAQTEKGMQKPGTSSEMQKSGTSAETKGGADMKGGAATTGQSAGGAAKASLTTEQKTKVRETVFKSGPRVTNVNFNISVGTVVPRTVRFATLPPILVEYYPQWRGYDYFIYEEEIVIIEPRTLKIVAVISV